MRAPHVAFPSPLDCSHAKSTDRSLCRLDADAPPRRPPAGAPSRTAPRRSYRRAQTLKIRA